MLTHAGGRLGELNLEGPGSLAGLLRAPAEMGAEMAQVWIGVERLLDHVGAAGEADHVPGALDGARCA